MGKKKNKASVMEGVKDHSPDKVMKSCAYCLGDGDEMNDPRLAPCGHVFCLGCLKDAIKSLGDKTTLNCPLCDRKHDLVALGGVESFPIPFGDALVAVTPEPVPEDVCQICKIDGIVALAISFCRECNGLLCYKHQKQHDKFHSGLFSLKHEIIPVSEYSKAKARFKLRMCLSHPKNELDGMCIKCMEPNCSTCRSFVDGFNCESGEKHKSRPIQELAVDIKVRVTGAVAEVVTLVTELQELVELSEKNGAENDVELDKLITSIDDVMNQQVEEIRRKYEEMKSKVVVLRGEDLERKENYQGDLQERMKNLQHRVEDINLSLETKHNVDVIREGEAMCDQLAKERSVKTTPLLLVRRELLPVAKCRGVELELIDALPLELLADGLLMMSNGGQCRSIRRTLDGGLVAAGVGVFDVWDTSGQLITSVALSGDVNVCAIKGQEIFVLQNKQVKPAPQRQVMRFSMTGQQLGSWPVTYDSCKSNLALVGESVIVPVSTQRRVEVYSMDGQFMSDIRHPSFSGSELYLATTSEDTAIVTDSTSHLVTKFNVQGGEVVWQTKGPASPVEPAVDAAGSIWVPCCDGQTVHVLSSNGTFIKEFAVPGATKVTGSTVCNNQLLLASKAGLLKYKMRF